LVRDARIFPRRHHLMSKGLTRAQAEVLARQGKAVRRDAWRRWLLFSAWSRTFFEVLPPDGETPEVVRTALSVSATGGSPDQSNFTFSQADSLAHDWTDESWSTAVTPPSTVPSGTSGPVTCICTDGTTTSPSSPGTITPSPSEPIEPPYPPSPFTPRVPGKPRPHDPPSGTDPIIRVTAVALDEPTGGSCWVSPDLSYIRVAVQVTVTGGPPGLGGLDLRYQSQTKLLGNGHAGYNQTTLLLADERPFFTPGATYPFEVRYYAEGRNGKPALFYWRGVGTLTIAPICPHAPHTVTFDGNGSTGGAMSPQTSTVGAALTANAFNRTSYVFTEWNTAADGSGIGVADAGMWLFASDVTLYAQWTIYVPVLPITVYCTGGYTANSPATLANGLADPNGCTPVSRGTITTTAGTGSSVDVNGAAFVSGTPYSSVEAQALDADGVLVYSAHTSLAAGPAPASLSVSYAACVAWIAAGSVFAGGGAWCNNQMG